jgi:hypothetical protein
VAVAGELVAVAGELVALDVASIERYRRLDTTGRSCDAHQAMRQN